MIYTARQVQEILAKGGDGAVRLPLGARLTPSASDLVRAKKIVIRFDGATGPSPQPSPGVPGEGAAAKMLWWWCDGPCGHAKAAVSSLGGSVEVKTVAEAQGLVAAIRELQKALADGAGCGLLLVKQAGAAAVLANRCSNLRAFVGTSIECVESAVREAAANVMLIEYPRQPLTAIRSMLGGFVRGQRKPSAELLGQLKELKELAACG